MRLRWTWLTGSAAVLFVLMAAGATFLQADLLAAPDVILVAGTWLAIGIVLVVNRIEKRFLRSHRPSTWIGRRFGRGPRGIVLTASLMFTIVCTVLFYMLGQRVSLVNSEVSRLDLRIVDLARAQDTFSQRPMMSSLTEIGRGHITAIMLVLIAIGALIAGAKRAVLSMVAIPVLSSIAVTILKSSYSRPRPAIGSLLEASHSFPSGHSAGGLALAMGVLVMTQRCGFKRTWLASAIMLPLGLSIGYSRAYLSIHWTSDVVGGWLMASIATGLVLIVSLSLPCAEERSEVKHRWIDAGLGAASVVALIVGFIGARNSFPAFPPTKSERIVQLEGVVRQLPATSETLFGRQVEPVNLLVTGSERDLRNDMEKVGYMQVLPLTPKRVLEAFGSKDRNGLAVSRVFLDTRVQDLAMQMPSEDGRTRHYARFWRLPISLDNGCAVWAINATSRNVSSHSWWQLIPGSEIQPKVDDERELLVRELENLGLFHYIGLRSVSHARKDRAAEGGTFITDGKLALLETLAPCESGL